MFRLLICLGCALMAYNIRDSVDVARRVRQLELPELPPKLPFLPAALSALLLLCGLAAGIFGQPGPAVTVILLAGGVLALVMNHLLEEVAQRAANREAPEVEPIEFIAPEFTAPHSSPAEHGPSENAPAADELAAETARLRARIGELAAMSRVLRAPTSAIRALDRAALDEPDAPPCCREGLEALDLSAQCLLGLIDGMQEIARAEDGVSAPRSETFRLSDALGRVSAVIQALCGEKGLTYYVSQRADRRCLGDEARLTEALLALLDNAVRYTDAPGIVRLDVERADGDGDVRGLRFTVSDTGVGMDAARLSSLFDGSARSLARVKRLIEEMGGALTVQSEQNAGSTFTVTLPLEPAEEAEDARAEDIPAPPKRSLAGRRLLIVEDNPANARLVAELLSPEGVKTEYAESGRRALALYNGAPPGYFDAILMDLRMAEMDSMEAARRIRALNRPDAKTVPIIALTSGSLSGNVRHSLAAGVNVHLAKPADAELLNDTLRRLVGDAREVEEEQA